MRILGFTEEITSCDCCGKQDLKGTYAMDNAGEVLYFGSVCGQKAAGWSSDEFKANWKGVKSETKKTIVREQKAAWSAYLKLYYLKVKPDLSNEEELYLTYKKALKGIQIQYPLYWKQVFKTDLRHVEL